MSKTLLSPGKHVRQADPAGADVPRQESVPPAAGSREAPAVSYTAEPQVQTAVKNDQPLKPDVSKLPSLIEPGPQYVSTHKGEDGDTREHIVGSIYFPAGRIRLIHFAGPEIEEFSGIARYIIGGENFDIIYNIAKRLCQRHEDQGFDQNVSVVAENLVKDTEFSSAVMLADDFITSQSDKQGLPPLLQSYSMYQFGEVYKLRDEFQFHVSRGGIEAIKPDFTALDNQQNIENIYSIVALAQEIDDAASRILESRSPQAPQKEKEDFRNKVDFFLQQAPEASKGYFQQIQQNVNNVFSEDSLLQAFKLERSTIRESIQSNDAKETETYVDQVIAFFSNGDIADWIKYYPELLQNIKLDIQDRFKGFFRNQILWHSGIIEKLGLPVDQLDRPLQSASSQSK